jgi:hypothetical protein
MRRIVRAYARASAAMRRLLRAGFFTSACAARLVAPGLRDGLASGVAAYGCPVSGMSLQLRSGCAGGQRVRCPP